MSEEEIQSHVEASGLHVISIRTSQQAKMAFCAIPDTNAIKPALDIAHKLTGNYATQKLGQDIKLPPPVITGMRVIYEKD